MSKVKISELQRMSSDAKFGSDLSKRALSLQEQIEAAKNNTDVWICDYVIGKNGRKTSICKPTKVKLEINKYSEYNISGYYKYSSDGKRLLKSREMLKSKMVFRTEQDCKDFYNLLVATEYEKARLIVEKIAEDFVE